MRWLQQGHQRFLAGQSLHPHSTRERMQAVELLFDGGFGDLFVVRNAGTMSTTAAIASLEYAVGHLDVPLIVVLGHEGCGAVSAALQPELVLIPSLAQVLGQLRMELLQYGGTRLAPPATWCIPVCCSRIGSEQSSSPWWRGTTTYIDAPSNGWEKWSPSSTPVP